MQIKIVSGNYILRQAGMDASLQCFFLISYRDANIVMLHDRDRNGFHFINMAGFNLMQIFINNCELYIPR